jgi:hypothetical protein
VDTTTFHSAIGFQTLGSIDTSTAVAPTAAYNGIKATKLRLTVEGAAIRFRYDGTAPTSGVGHYVGTLNQFEIYGEENIANLRIIATSGTATVTVTAEVA